MPRPNVSALGDTHASYTTKEEAVRAALRSIKESHTETGGAVLYNPVTKQYAYTQPVGNADDAHFSAAIHVPPGWQISALFHTHPKGQRSTQFSEDDIHQSQTLKVPSYILPYMDGKIRGFDPSSSPVSKSVEGQFSLGTVLEEEAAAAPSAKAQSAASVSDLPGGDL